jgi:F-type H+-transporting ATPase subunit b
MTLQTSPHKRFFCTAAIVVSMIKWFAPCALAAEAAPAWRATYDLVLRWVNFLILAGVIVKYSRTPIKNFLSLQSAETSEEIHSFEAEKERISIELEAAIRQGQENQKQLDTLKQRIISEGERRQQEIITDAEQQAAVVLSEAQRKITHRLIQAKMEFRDELVDMAMDMAIEKLPNLINDQDHQRLQEAFLQQASLG